MNVLVVAETMNRVSPNAAKRLIPRNLALNQSTTTGEFRRPVRVYRSNVAFSVPTILSLSEDLLRYCPHQLRLFSVNTREKQDNTAASPSKPTGARDESQTQKAKQSDHIVEASTIPSLEHRTFSDANLSTSDPPIWTWIDTYLPSTWKPYARLARMDKPIGTWLLLWPCYWSTALATSPGVGSLPDPSLLALFGVGAVVMRGAGCTINDIWDADVDRQVSRTSSRPLASGAVTQSQAWAFLAAQLTTGLAVLLSLPHTMYCFYWGAASLPLVVAYPAMKRFFPYPQLVLGLTFNWGAWMGWAATHGSMDFAVVGPLYMSGITWTLVYDTIYAHQDKVEDRQLGLQSTALTFGEDNQQRRILHGLAMATYLQWMLVGHQAELAAVYYAGITAAYGHLAWQVQSADFNEPHNVMTRFRSNSAVGALVFGSLVAGTYFS